MSEINEHPESGTDATLKIGARLINDMVTETSTSPVDVRPSAVIERADKKEEHPSHAGHGSGKRTHDKLRKLINVGK